MFIAIDIGNSHTVLGFFKEAVLCGQLRLSSRNNPTDALLIKQVKSFLKNIHGKKTDIHGAGISSVVPALTKQYRNLVRKFFALEPLCISTKANLGLTVHYDKPLTLGTDRICAAVAGYAKYGGPLIIVDLGTATTYDVVASNGDFLGGVIAPGIGTSLASLKQSTAQLPHVDAQLPRRIIATNTTQSIQAGSLYGSLDALEAMIGRIRKELEIAEPKIPSVIGTGGFSEFAAGHSQALEHIEPALVLEGIRLIYERQKGTSNSSKE